MADPWSRLRPASYRGVPFHVRGDRARGGRRIAVHEAVGAEYPITEDFGGAEQTFTVECYAAGDDSGAQALALSSILQAGGVGPLTLPLGDFALCRCLRWRRDRKLDRIGFVGFRANFLVIAGPSGFIAGFSHVMAALTGGRSLFTAVFGGRF